VQSYTIVSFNQRTYVSGGVVCVVRDRRTAEQLAQNFKAGQSETDRLAGWRYFIEESDLKPGMDRNEATRIRQLRFDLQDSLVPGSVA
jgi:hypothetical protein